MKILKFAIINICVLGLLTSCKPSYTSPLETPDLETMAADEPYDMDFIQVNNEAIEYYSDAKIQKIFPFIKNLDIDGSNDPKNIELTLEVADGVTDDAIQILVTDISKRIGDSCQEQDFRLKASSEDTLGSVYDLYDYHFVVTQEDQTVYDEIIKAGDSFPFDVTVDGNAVKSAISQLNQSSASAESNASTESSAEETVESSPVETSTSN